MKSGASTGQGTFLISELKLGWIYRDALSGCLVLVQEKEVTEYTHIKSTAMGDAHMGAHKVKRLVGWYWNPVYGAHKEMELNDHQLMSVRDTL